VHEEQKKNKKEGNEIKVNVKKNQKESKKLRKK
jgi:hypothetical protein